jgi:hypothetical protein
LEYTQRGLSRKTRWSSKNYKRHCELTECGVSNGRALKSLFNCSLASKVLQLIIRQQALTTRVGDRPRTARAATASGGMTEISEGRIPAVGRATPTSAAAPFAARVAPLRKSVVARAASFAAPIRMMPIATGALAGLRTLRERQLRGLRRENALITPLGDGLAGDLARHDRDSVPGIGNPLVDLRLARISGSQTEPISGREETVSPPTLHACLSAIVVRDAVSTVRPAGTDFQTARVVGRDGIEPSTSGLKVRIARN